MIAFLIKSTICMVVLYGFYHFILQQQKILLFNRFYLLFSVIFSLIIPLILIPIKSNFILNNSFDKLNFAVEHILQGETITVKTSPFFTFQNISTTLLLIVFSILLIRFTLNIFSIVRKIIKSKKVDNLKTTLVLIEIGRAHV
jgi:hypothetical protein